MHLNQVSFFQRQDQHAPKLTTIIQKCISIKCCFSGTRINIHQKHLKNNHMCTSIKCFFFLFLFLCLFFLLPGCTCSKTSCSSWTCVNIHSLHMFCWLQDPHHVSCRPIKVNFSQVLFFETRINIGLHQKTHSHESN